MPLEGAMKSATAVATGNTTVLATGTACSVWGACVYSGTTSTCKVIIYDGAGATPNLVIYTTPSSANQSQTVIFDKPIRSNGLVINRSVTYGDSLAIVYYA